MMDTYQRSCRLFFFLLGIATLSLSAQAPEATFVPIDHLYGYTQATYGEKDCNPCVNNVIKSLKEMRTGQKQGKRFPFQNKQLGIPSVGITTHAQGVARIPGVENENWLVFSKSGDTHDEAGFIFVSFDNLHSNGISWAKATPLKKNKWEEGKSQVFFHDPTHQQDHPGGIQALGRTLVSGSDGPNGTLVDFYDASNPHRVIHLNRLKIDGSQGEKEMEPGGKGASAHFISAAKLRDGRYLLFVAKHHRDFFQSTRGKAWAYVSDTKSIQSQTKWKYISFVSFTPQGIAYQGANLITEASTGKLYLAMMRPDLLMKNYIDLWEVKANPKSKEIDDSIKIKLVHTQTVWSRGNGGTFDAGGGIHITPQGKMLIYMIDRWQGFDGQINLEEYRSLEE